MLNYADLFNEDEKKRLLQTGIKNHIDGIEIFSANSGSVQTLEEIFVALEEIAKKSNIPIKATQDLFK